MCMCRAAPAILFLPHLQLWWASAPASLRATLWMLLADLPPDLPLLLLATADTPLEVGCGGWGSWILHHGPWACSSLQQGVPNDVLMLAWVCRGSSMHA